MLRKHEGNRHVTDFGLLRASLVHEKRKRHVVIYKFLEYTHKQKFSLDLAQK